MQHQSIDFMDKPSSFIDETFSEDNLWIEQTINNFDEVLRDNFSQEMNVFTAQILAYICALTQGFRGVFFLWEKEANHYKAHATYGCSLKTLLADCFEKGDSLIGQAAETKKMYYFKNLPSKHTEVRIANVDINLAAYVIVPLNFNDEVYGILELSFLKNPSPKFIHFLERARKSIAAMLESIMSHERTKELLEKTEEQKKMLAQQEGELRQNLQELALIQEALKSQNREIEQAFNALEKYNNRILDSINYAQRIQQAILPSTQLLNKHFAEHFVVFLPKDVVSGDFYWFGQIKEEGTKKILRRYIAVVDCTGHGVPGAFMSMIGSALLNQLIIEKRLQKPSEVLSQLHEQVRIALNQESSENNDGMSLSLCAIEELKNKEYRITFAGSKSTIFVQHLGDLVSYKGDRIDIGGLNRETHANFKDTSFIMRKGENIYLTSDGFLDACNPKRRKYGEKRLTHLLENIKNLPLKEQGKRLYNDLNDYQNGEDQRDDITFLGIKL
ncbi:MAG: hypothetical protein EAZ55_10280 [Cytophagales bacterium]|nr:MAG: hypothetical protein EAZ55_10280 [Cytophagales bacterium]